MVVFVSPFASPKCTSPVGEERVKMSVSSASSTSSSVMTNPSGMAVALVPSYVPAGIVSVSGDVKLWSLPDVLFPVALRVTVDGLCTSPL